MSRKIYALSSQALTGVGVAANGEDCSKVLRQLHDILFKSWDGLDDFKSFAEVLSGLLDVLISKSMLSSFPFNLKAMDKLLSSTMSLW